MMKALLITLAIVFQFNYDSFCQQPDNLKHPRTKADYLQKSREQRIGGFILLGGGIIGIAAVAPGNASFGTTGTVAVLSTAAILGSIPLFLAAHRNKKKAARMSAYNDLDKRLHALSATYQTNTYYGDDLDPAFSLTKKHSFFW